MRHSNRKRDTGSLVDAEKLINKMQHSFVEKHDTPVTEGTPHSDRDRNQELTSFLVKAQEQSSCSRDLSQCNKEKHI